MRTGTRCTILIQLPDAFCGGSSAKAAPVPGEMPLMRPENATREPYRSASSSTGCPIRICCNCTSLKFASTHTSSSGTMPSSGVPGATRWPICTPFLPTTPRTGDTIVVRSSASAASRTRAAARNTCGCCSGVVPSVWDSATFRSSRAARSAASRPRTLSRACATSSAETAPPPAIELRRARSWRARSSSVSRTATCALRRFTCMNVPRTCRTVFPRSATAESIATRASAGSSSSSVWPAATVSVSRVWIARTLPGTSAVICTMLPPT